MIIIRHRDTGPINDWFHTRLTAFIERIEDDLVRVAQLPIDATELSPSLQANCAPMRAMETGNWLDPLHAMRATHFIHQRDETLIGFDKSLHPMFWGGPLTPCERTEYRIENDGRPRIAEVLL